MATRTKAAGPARPCTSVRAYRGALATVMTRAMVRARREGGTSPGNRAIQAATDGAASNPKKNIASGHAPTGRASSAEPSSHR